MARTARTFGERAEKSEISLPEPTPMARAAGQNVRLQDAWRERIIKLIPNDWSYRTLSEKAILPSGRPLAHTTIRAVLLNQGSINLDTLAAICDALGADLAYVVTGKSTKANATALPVVNMSDAARWKEIADDPKRISELYFTSVSDAKGLMAARVMDDSMQPDYRRGDIVLYRKGEPVAAGRPAIVQLEGSNDTMMRLWRPAGDRVKLQAANEDYGSQTVAANRIAFVAHVVGLARDLG